MHQGPKQQQKLLQVLAFMVYRASLGQDCCTSGTFLTQTPQQRDPVHPWPLQVGAVGGPPPTLSKYLPNEANLYGLKWNLFKINGCVKNKVKGQQQTEWASIWAFFFFLTRGITDGKPRSQAEGMGGFTTQTFVARTFFTM